MLGRAGNERHRADLALQPSDRPKDLELQERDTVAIGIERQALEDDIGKAAIGGHVALSLLGGDQRIGKLRLRADMNAHLDLRQVEFATVRPDTTYAGNRPLAQPDRDIGEIAERLHFRPTALAAGALDGRLLLETRRPYQRAAEAGATIEAAYRHALVRAGNARRREPRSGDRAAAVDQRAVYHAASQCARRLADDRPQRTEHRTERGPCRLKDNGGHGNPA